MYDPGPVNMYKDSIQMLAENCRSPEPKGGFYAFHWGEARNEFINNVVTISEFIILNTNGRTRTKHAHTKPHQRNNIHQYSQTSPTQAFTLMIPLLNRTNPTQIFTTCLQ